MHSLRFFCRCILGLLLCFTLSGLAGCLHKRSGHSNHLDPYHKEAEVWDAWAKGGEDREKRRE